MRAAIIALGWGLAGCVQGAVAEVGQDAAAPGVTEQPRPPSARSRVFLVSLGKRSFPEDLMRAVEKSLRDTLQVEVRRLDPQKLPKHAYYKPRRRSRAEKLLEHLESQLLDDSEDGRVLGLTTVDISTTKGRHRDWGIFGLAYMPGKAAVISMYRLKRKARSREHLRFRVATTAVHETGHTFGLDHCEEDRCVMLDAQGGIENTDSSTGTLGPGCRARLDEKVPLPK